MLMQKRFEEAYIKHSLLEICHEMSSETTQTLDLTVDIDILIDSVSRGATSLDLTNPPIRFFLECISVYDLIKYAGP
jgi:hypothetical protein